MTDSIQEQAQPLQGLAEKNARNARVQQRYDQLMTEGKHGHYETMFRVVREEVEAALRPARASESAEPMGLVERLRNGGQADLANMADALMNDLGDARMQLETLLDIWDDGRNSPPGEGCYTGEALGLQFEEAGATLAALRAALEAPEGAAVQESDERAEFEKWARDRHRDVQRYPGRDSYRSAPTQERWYGWIARAALTPSPALGALPPASYSALVWLYSHCRAIGMTQKSLSGTMEDDIALFTVNLHQRIRNFQPLLTDDKIRAAWNRTQDPVAMVRELMGRQARMLTLDEAHATLLNPGPLSAGEFKGMTHVQMTYERFNAACESVQRKFCEVNGIALSAQKGESQ